MTLCEINYIIKQVGELVMSKKVKKVEKPTKEQTELGEKLPAVIEFYYSIDRRKLSEKILSDSNKKNIQIFLKAIYGDVLSYDNVNHTFSVRLPHKLRSDNYPIKFIQQVDNKSLKRFITIMDQLKDEIKEGNRTHLLLTGVDDFITTTITTQEEQKLEDNKIGSFESEERFFGPYDKEMKGSIALVNHAVFDTIRAKSTVGQAANDVCLARALHERQYKVMPITNFGCNLLALKSKDMVRKNPHFMSIFIKTIFDLLTAILIQFHLAFDNFNRIKICETCGKLTYETKKGARVYCSTLCRVKDSISKEDKEKRLCRERQKAWGRYYMKDIKDNLNPVLKSECAKCKEIVESSQCQIMLERNKKEFEKARKRKEAARKGYF